MSSYTILTSRLVAKLWSSVYEITLRHRRRDGCEETLLREVVDHGGAAAVLPIDPARGTCLLVRQMRMGAFFAGHQEPLLEACAGLLDGDTPEACVHKEGLEELGYRLHDLCFVADVFASPGAHTERIALYTARYGVTDRLQEGGGLAHEGEDIEIIEMPLRQAHGLIASGGIVDAKTVILLQHALAAGQ